MSEELNDIKHKLDELNDLFKLVHTRERSEDKTLVDFFKPLMTRILKVINDDLCNEMDRYSIYGEEDYKSRITATIASMDINQLLEKAQNIVDEPEVWQSRAKELWDQGLKLQAVKLVKQSTIWGLKESKDWCDNNL